MSRNRIPTRGSEDSTLPKCKVLSVLCLDFGGMGGMGGMGGGMQGFGGDEDDE